MGNVLDWRNLYGDSWQGEIDPAAFAHPAKFAHGLIRRIYQHALGNGYIRPGDSVIDPFGGVALGARYALQYGLNWTGVELEARFQELGMGVVCPGITPALFRRYNGRAATLSAERRRIPHTHHFCFECERLVDNPPERTITRREPHTITGNIPLWHGRYAPHFPQWGTAQLLQGDSRQLAAIVQQAAVCVSSPPYTGSALGNDAGCVRLDGKEDERRQREGTFRRAGYGVAGGQLGSMPEGQFTAAIASPPYSVETLGHSRGKAGEAREASGKYKQGYTNNDLIPTNYGPTPGQLGNLVEGQFSAAISSPPYADAVAGKGEGPGARHDPVYHNGDNAYKQSSAAEYGRTAGNLGNLNGNGGYHAAVSSPPFEKQQAGGGISAWMRGEDTDYAYAYPEKHRTNGSRPGYMQQGDSEGQLGSDKGETFWTAARLIVEQVHTVLRPGGYSIWVCKDFVRNKKRVTFSDQWEQLCAAVGFVPVERIRAWVVEEGDTQMDIFGNGHSKTIERKSFFRRLAEKNGSPRIDWEDVIIMQKTTGVTP